MAGRKRGRGTADAATSGGLIRKSLLLKLEEDEALRKRAFEERVSESSLVRRALRELLGMAEEGENGTE